MPRRVITQCLWHMDKACLALLWYTSAVTLVHGMKPMWCWRLMKLEISYYKSSSVCLFVCLSVCSLSPPRSFDRSSPNLVGVCRWTSELPLRGSFSKRSTGRRVNGSLSLSTILYICQPHSTQLQKATLLLQHLIRLKGTFCCIDGWWVYLGGSRNCLLDGSSMACIDKCKCCQTTCVLKTSCVKRPPFQTPKAHFSL